MKKFLALTLSAAMVTSLSGCTAADSVSKKNENTATEPAIIMDDGPQIDYEECTLSFSWWGDNAANEATLAAIEAFERKYPGITIHESFGVWNSFSGSMTSQLASGTTSDVSQIDVSWISSYSPEGELFLDLHDVSDVLDITQIEQSYLDKCTISDKLQAVPVSMTGCIFFWDKTSFDKAGISTPSTLEELLAAGSVFEEKLGKDYYPLVLDENDKMILMVYYLESVYGKAWMENDTLNYTTEEIQKGLEFIQALEDAHVIPSSEQLLKDDAASLSENKNWVNGKYAGIFAWDYEAAEFEASLKKGREFVVGEEFADMGSHQGGFSKISMAYAISKDCEHPKEAALLIDFLLNQKTAGNILTSTKGIPLSKTALSYGLEQELFDKSLLEAHEKIKNHVSFEMDTAFENVNLTDTKSGIYFYVMAALSYGDYDAQSAAQMLSEGIMQVLSPDENIE